MNPESHRTVIFAYTTPESDMVEVEEVDLCSNETVRRYEVPRGEFFSPDCEQNQGVQVSDGQNGSNS